MLLYQSAQNCTFGNTASELLKDLDTSCDSYRNAAFGQFNSSSSSSSSSASSNHPNCASATMFDCGQVNERNRCAQMIANTNNDQSTLLNDLTFDHHLNSMPSQLMLSSVNVNPINVDLTIGNLNSMSNPNSIGFGNLNVIDPIALNQLNCNNNHNHNERNNNNHNGNSSNNSTNNNSTEDINNSSISAFTPYNVNSSRNFGNSNTELEYSNSNGSFNSPPHSPPMKNSSIYAIGSSTSYLPQTSNDYLTNNNNNHQSQTNANHLNSNLNKLSTSTYNSLIASANTPVELKLEDIDSALDEEESELGDLFMDDNSLGAMAFGNDFTPNFMSNSNSNNNNNNTNNNNNNNNTTNNNNNNNNGNNVNNSRINCIGTGTNVDTSIVTTSSNNSLISSANQSIDVWPPMNSSSNMNVNESLNNTLQLLSNTPVSLTNTPLPNLNDGSTSQLGNYSRTSTPSMGGYNGLINMINVGSFASTSGSDACTLDDAHQLNGKLLNQITCVSNVSSASNHSSSPYDSCAYNNASSIHFKSEPNDESYERSISQCSNNSYSPVIGTNQALPVTINAANSSMPFDGLNTMRFPASSFAMHTSPSSTSTSSTLYAFANSSNHENNPNNTGTINNGNHVNSSSNHQPHHQPHHPHQPHQPQPHPHSHPHSHHHNRLLNMDVMNNQHHQLGHHQSSINGQSMINISDNVSNANLTDDNKVDALKNALMMRTNDANKMVRNSQVIRTNVNAIKKHSINRSNSVSRANQKANVNPASLLCAVCGDTAACQHYGVRTCEGCKGFFKRTVQKASKYVCLANRECIVDKRRRNRCQFCRFQKCLAVGMVKEVVRTDSLKGRRGRLPSRNNEKHPHAAGSANAPISTIAALESAFNEMCSDFEEMCEHVESDSLFGQRSSSVTDSNQMMQQIRNVTVDCIVNFAKKVPSFDTLCVQDQHILIDNCVGEFASILLSYYNSLDADEYVFGKWRFRRDDFEKWFSGWLIQLKNLLPQLEPIYSDSASVACILVICLLSNRYGLNNLEEVAIKQRRFVDTLRDHITYDAHAQQMDLQLPKLLSLMSNLRSFTSCLESNTSQ